MPIKSQMLSARGSARGSSRLHIVVTQATILLKSIRGKPGGPKAGALTRFFRAAAFAIIAMIRLRPRLTPSEVHQIKTMYDSTGGITSTSKLVLFAQALGVQPSDEVATEVLGHQRYTEGHVMDLRTVLAVFERCKRDQLAAKLKRSSAREAFDSLGGDTSTGVVEVSRMMDAIDQFGLNVDLESVAQAPASAMSPTSSPMAGSATAAAHTLNPNGGGTRRQSVISYQVFADLVDSRNSNHTGEENWWETVGGDDEDWFDTAHPAWSPQRGEVGFATQPTPSAAVYAPTVSAPLVSTNSDSIFNMRFDIEGDTPTQAPREHGPFSRGLSIRGSPSFLAPSVSVRGTSSLEIDVLARSKSDRLPSLPSPSLVSSAARDPATPSPPDSGDSPPPEYHSSVNPSQEEPSSDAVVAVQKKSKPLIKNTLHQRPQTAPGRPIAIGGGSKAHRWKDFIDRVEVDCEKRASSRISSAQRRNVDFVVTATTSPCFTERIPPGANWREDVPSLREKLHRNAARHSPADEARPPFVIRPSSADLQCTSGGAKLQHASNSSSSKRASSAACHRAASRGVATVSRTTAAELAYVPGADELMDRWTLTASNPKHALA